MLSRTTNEIARHRGTRFEQFDAIRTAMKQLTTVDAFYVGEFVGSDTVHFHHQYDGEFFDLPGSLPIRPGRTAQWVRTHKRSYVYRSDDGKLLNAGVMFGRMDRLSHDAVVSPIFDGTSEREVMGLISIQSYTPNVYDQVVVKALEHLAEVLGVQATYEARMARRSPRLSVGLPDDGSEVTVEDVLGELLDALQAHRASIERSRVQTSNDDYDAAAGLLALRRSVDRLQSEVWARELHYQHLVVERLTKLTGRQRELAELLGEDSRDTDVVPTIAQLAKRMGITEATVKSHMNIVLRVFEVEAKSEVGAAVRRLKHRPADT
ncbi:helix-turn-helix transcriptional regulator [Amycolatopsis sp. NPDC059027]|uniref:helix-turn-helix transcriptional regulator n=1 Tax=Amycolatopsis sp. NPDC059027 TaxID=3346709 RepID=UPI00366E234C